MSVFRIEKTNNYTVMSNYHLKDINLSYKAKELLSFMLSLPDDWDYSVKALVKVSKESIKAIRSTLKELEDMGYLTRTRIQLNNGRFDYEYAIYEKPYTQKGNTENGDTLKDTQINTKEINIKEQDKIDKAINIITKELIKNKKLIKILTNNNKSLTLKNSTLNEKLESKEDEIEELKEENFNLKYKLNYFESLFKKLINLIKDMFKKYNKKEQDKEFAEDLYNHGIINERTMSKLKFSCKNNDKEKDNFEL